MYRFKICRDCFMDAQNETGLCPGCKEPYRLGDYDEDPQDYANRKLQLPGPNGKRDANNMTMMKRNQTGEFDHNRWLFETKGTYGVGNAYWPPDNGDGEQGFQDGMLEPADKPFKPLSRRLPIAAGIISPYRYTSKMHVHYTYILI